MRRRICLFLSFLLLASLVSAAPTVPQLFQKAKQQFRLAAYSDSLRTLDEIAKLAALSENESYRTALTPALAFYRGVCLAALGRRAEARPQLETYLTFEPNARLDPAIYSRKVIDTLEEVRRGLTQRVEGPAEPGPHPKIPKPCRSHP